jgi:Ca-activated chloride channel family protein
MNIVEDTSRECAKLKKKACMIVFFSDGENTGDENTLVRAVKLAEREGIKVITVGIGEDNPSRISVYEDGVFSGYEKGEDGGDYLTGIDKETLKFIAEGSHGIYIRENEASRAVDFIDKNLAQEKIEVRAETSPISVYLLLASIVALAILKKYGTV